MTVPIKDRQKTEVGHYGLHAHGGTWFLLQGIVAEKITCLVEGLDCPFVVNQYQAIRPCLHQIDITDYYLDRAEVEPFITDEVVKLFLPLPALAHNRLHFLQGSTENLYILTQLARLCSPKTKTPHFLAGNAQQDFKYLGTSNMQPFLVYGVEPHKTAAFGALQQRAAAVNQRVIVLGNEDTILPPGFKRIKPDWEKLDKLVRRPINWERIGSTVVRHFMLGRDCYLHKFIPEMEQSFGTYHELGTDTKGS